MLRKLAKQYAGSTVMLVKRIADVNGSAAVIPMATAFVCASPGYLLTCAHTFNLTDSLAFVPQDSDDKFFPLTLDRFLCVDVVVAQFDPINDVALLKVTGNAGFTVPNNLMREDAPMPQGALIAYLGFPFPAQLHVCHVGTALVSAKVLSADQTRQYQLDAMIHEGCSGGPVIDVETGKISAIVTSRFSPSGGQGGIFVGGYSLGSDSGIAYALPISYGIDLMRAEGIDV